MVTRLCRRDMEANGVKSKLSATTDRRRALTGANYVFCVVRIGGLAAFKTDIEIPLKFRDGSRLARHGKSSYRHAAPFRIL